MVCMNRFRFRERWCGCLRMTDNLPLRLQDMLGANWTFLSTNILINVTTVCSLDFYISGTNGFFFWCFIYTSRVVFCHRCHLLWLLYLQPHTDHIHGEISPFVKFVKERGRRLESTPHSRVWKWWHQLCTIFTFTWHTELLMFSCSGIWSLLGPLFSQEKPFKPHKPPAVYLLWTY